MASPLPSAEAELLLDTVCASDESMRRSGAPSAIDWLVVGQLAERENLQGLLWPALSKAEVAVPEAVAGAMRRQALVSQFRMAVLQAKLAQVVGLLNEHDIPVMLMKGSALAVTRYGSFARRPMGDLDLLVHEQDVRPAWDLLRGLGWRPEREGVDAFYEEHQHLNPLVAPGGANVVVELHRCFLYPHGPFQLPETQVWATASPVGIDGHRALAPSPEYLMLHLCLHFGWSHQMRFGLGRAVRDVRVLVPTIDWDRLVDLAQTTRAESCCYWTLRLAAQLGRVPVPDAVLASLAPRRSRWSRQVLERIITVQAMDPRQEFVPSVQLSRLLWTLAIRPRASGHGKARPWRSREDFGKFTHGVPPRGIWPRIRGQLAMLPLWVRFAVVALGLGRSSHRGRGHLA